MACCRPAANLDESSSAVVAIHSVSVLSESSEFIRSACVGDGDLPNSLSPVLCADCRLPGVPGEVSIGSQPQLLTSCSVSRLFCREDKKARCLRSPRGGLEVESAPELTTSTQFFTTRPVRRQMEDRIGRDDLVHQPLLGNIRANILKSSIPDLNKNEAGDNGDDFVPMGDKGIREFCAKVMRAREHHEKRKKADAMAEGSCGEGSVVDHHEQGASEAHVSRVCFPHFEEKEEAGERWRRMGKNTNVAHSPCKVRRVVFEQDTLSGWKSSGAVEPSSEAGCGAFTGRDEARVRGGAKHNGFREPQKEDLAGREGILCFLEAGAAENAEYTENDVPRLGSVSGFYALEGSMLRQVRRARQIPLVVSAPHRVPVKVTTPPRGVTTNKSRIAHCCVKAGTGAAEVVLARDCALKQPSEDQSSLQSLSSRRIHDDVSEAEAKLWGKKMLGPFTVATEARKPFPPIGALPSRVELANLPPLGSGPTAAQGGMPLGDVLNDLSISSRLHSGSSGASCSGMQVTEQIPPSLPPRLGLVVNSFSSPLAPANKKEVGNSSRNSLTPQSNSLFQPVHLCPRKLPPLSPKAAI
ncbi:uncharacterized protein Tco025E_07806 [Trypanosoma conorhini]|uniref:Uncharacterized protein n=1 Tax=Trypanosoma conorhini TaxID=83891 RepID=A0A3R7MMM9_9TRYP|nr:uncharacterized protein Tco025E_07806 [Trypanosoma conorhini]RNF05284.1 hypothetical protein Tco025E_07806 [Trypanosoma conorhini]